MVFREKLIVGVVRVVEVGMVIKCVVLVHVANLSGRLIVCPVSFLSEGLHHKPKVGQRVSRFPTILPGQIL